MSATVQDARPPTAMLRVINPAMKAILRTPAARLLRSLALLEFTGARSGRRISVVVGYHEVKGATAVFTPAPWRNNFATDRPIVVRHQGRTHNAIGSLQDDPTSVATALRSLISSGTSGRAFGLRVSKSHTITADDVIKVNRAMILLRPTDHASG